MPYKVFPAPRSISLNITQRVINKSEESTTGKCMVAQALRERGFKSVNVNSQRARFNDQFNEYRYSYDLPAKAKIAVEQFDKNKKLVKPFALQLSYRQGTVSEVIIKGPNKPKKNQKKVTRKAAPKNCKRRFHGLQVISSPK